ncbi:MAG: HEPN domain-containing protein [Methanobrevibacter sp.]|nr:HEPN domain-containing protein [Methanobrevibacter sp.]
MSFNWGKFYDVGLCLTNISEKEEYKRSAVGRFYYAAFGLVKNYYEENHHQKVPSNEGHSFLIKNLKNSNFKEEVDLGKNLEKLREYRNQADYRNRFNLINVKRAEKKYKTIAEILEELDENPLYLKFD